VIDVSIDDRTGRVTRVYTGLAVLTPLARGEHGPLERRLHLFMVIAGVLFLLPFVDPRRPLRMLHLDLAAMLGLGLHQFFFVRGHLETAVWLIYPVLLYVLARVLWLMSRAPARHDRVVPLLSIRVLAAALVAVVAARIAINVFGDHPVLEGGYDSVWGAATIRHGFELYARSAFPLNAYGPVTYLAYIPFELVFPLPGGIQRGNLAAAHAAAITWDLLAVCGLVILGRRLRPGRDGTLLGLALAFAFATYPWTVAVIAVSTNDGLVPALLIWTLVLASSRPARAALLGLATAAKFFPLPLAPTFARGDGEDDSPRSIAIYTGVVVVVLALAIVPYLPHPGGLGQFYDLTVSAQVNRHSQLSIWGLHPSLDWLQALVRALTALLAVALFFVPRRRTTVTLACAAAALIVAQQLSLEHWYYLYAAWFAPFALIAFFAAAYPARDSWTST
jgi:hypothetical protein